MLVDSARWGLRSPSLVLPCPPAPRHRMPAPWELMVKLRESWRKWTENGFLWWEKSWKTHFLIVMALCLAPTPEVGMMNPISEIRKLRIREFKGLAENLKTCKWCKGCLTWGSSFIHFTTPGDKNEIWTLTRAYKTLHDVISDRSLPPTIFTRNSSKIQVLLSLLGLCYYCSLCLECSSSSPSGWVSPVSQNCTKTSLSPENIFYSPYQLGTLPTIFKLHI